MEEPAIHVNALRARRKGRHLGQGDGCQMGVGWVSTGCPMGVGWVSNGCQMGVGWVSNGCRMGVSSRPSMTLRYSHDIVTVRVAVRFGQVAVQNGMVRLRPLRPHP